MAHVICEPCIGTLDGSCVQVCPVDAIHDADDCPGAPARGDAMLYIDPEACICCGACAAACPVEAIFPESDVPEPWTEFIAINAAAYEV